MKVLIVAKTHMGCLACVGGLTLDDNRNVRLLKPDAWNQPASTPYEIGDIWDLKVRPRCDIVPPHVEDVFVDSRRRIDRLDNVYGHLLSRVRLWQGGPEQLFDGVLRFTEQGSGYISRTDRLPSGSVGFWIPSFDLVRVEQEGRIRYRSLSGSIPLRIRHVGFRDAAPVLFQGTLLRVSLSRWWRPADGPGVEERCYLQLSGWYETLPTGESARAAGRRTEQTRDRIPS
jgi:ATP-dependent DNA helicase RecQ